MVHKKKSKIKKNDKIIVLTGKDKGKIGTVLKIDIEKGSLIAEKVNMIKKHAKPSTNNPQGGIIQKEAPINISNVMIVCNKCNEKTRVSYSLLGDRNKERICKRCGEPIDS